MDETVTSRLPQPAPEPEPILRPIDRPFAGRMELSVDVTDVERRIFRCRQRIPVWEPGRLTLLYPKWLPGYHSPAAPVELLAGLVVRVDGEAIPWTRDPVEVCAFHVDPPQGARALEVEFQFLSPTASDQGQVVVTPGVLFLQWNTVVLYPAGFFARGIEVAATLKTPQGWRYATALRTASSEGDTAAFEPVPLDVLVDSPVLAGRHFRRFDLDGDRVGLSVAAEDAAALEALPEQIDLHRRAVEQADRLFGVRHFDRFEILMGLSDALGANAVEHHRSCEIATVPGYFTDWNKRFPNRESMPHEYVHSWNGKYRRGHDSWTPAFDRPIRNSLMWVYEGLTQYWGHVLGARSGLWSRHEALETLANTAALHQARAGRRWRPMSDTTRDPIIAGRNPLPWPSWQRSEDYYSEGELLWLDIDTRVRELTGEARSLDDLARAFFGGGEPGSFVTSPYDFDDVAGALAEIAPFDWKGFLTGRLHTVELDPRLDGLERGGYRLVHTAQPNGYQGALDAESGATTLLFSVGLAVSSAGTVKEVMWESPAFDVGLTVGAEILTVGGEAFDPERLKQAVAATADGRALKLGVKAAGRERAVTLDYREGLRFAHLEPIPGKRRRLDEIYGT